MKIRYTGLIVVAVGLIAIGFQYLRGDGGAVFLVGLMLVWAIAALGYDLVFGLSGLLSFGHAAFLGSGAYAVAILTTQWMLPFSFAISISAVLGALLALVFGAAALRASGIYFGLLTLALAQLTNILLTVRLQGLTGGDDGISGVSRPTIYLKFLADDLNYLVYVGCIFLGALALSALLRRSPFGQVLRAASQNEVRAEQLGWNVRRYRLAIFAVSGAYTGIAGGLLAGLMQFAGPQLMQWSNSGDLIIMTLLGGRDSLLGPVIGVVLMTLLREVVGSYTEHWAGILGVVFVLCTLYMPVGVTGLWRHFRGKGAT
ncbi:branched-chain amino acid ABC transporter permease [Paraburkholderia sp. IW21]|uniref:branched-chain amino acid ABC transporter permease n=1 Tax=Paraburkholderia sp. IW21 TaxID=3242488 RepID=UPI00352103FC